MSRHICDLKIGDTLDFAHIEKNVKIQYPFKEYKRLTLIAGGTGITPIIQALHSILGNPDDKRQVVLLYGSVDSDNILCYQLLKQWENAYPNQLKVVHVLSQEPVDSEWKGERGYIGEAILKKYYFDSVRSSDGFFVCGPPAMNDALCGDRTKKEVTGILHDMGFEDSSVIKF